PSTVLLLHRLHTLTDPSPPPHRLFLPHISTFLPSPSSSPRIRTPLPQPLHHPFLLKTAFPSLGIEYKEDCQDYIKMEMPWLFERLILVDTGAALRSWREQPQSNREGIAEPVFAMGRQTNEDDQTWWEPVRDAVLRSFSLLHGTQKKSKLVV